MLIYSISHVNIKHVNFSFFLIRMIINHVINKHKTKKKGKKNPNLNLTSVKHLTLLDIKQKKKKFQTEEYIQQKIK